MNKTLVEFEQLIGFGSTYAARVLGVAYPTYAQYRSGSRKLPKYHARHIAVIELLPVKTRTTLVERHAHGE